MTTAVELVLIHSCQMFIINECGYLAADIGLVPFAVYGEMISSYVPFRAFVQTPTWLYPLDKAYSPILIFGGQNLIFPNPQSTTVRQTYVVIRLPSFCPDRLKIQLRTCLDMYGHVRGEFRMSRYIPRTVPFRPAITPHDSHDLDNAQPNVNAPDIKVLPPVKFPTLEVSGRPLNTEPTKLSVALHVTDKVGVSNEKKATVNSDSCCYQPKRCKDLGEKIVPNSHVKPQPVQPDPSSVMQVSVSTGATSDNWLILPTHGGSTMLRSINGPQDQQYVTITIGKTSVTIPFTLLCALKAIFIALVRQRAEKEKLGIPPSTDKKMGRLLGSSEEPISLNAFGADKPTRMHEVYVAEAGSETRPTQFRPAKKHQEFQHLETAAMHFIAQLEKGNFFLVSTKPDERVVTKIDLPKLLGALVDRPVTFRFGNSEKVFTILPTLSACAEAAAADVSASLALTGPPVEACEHHWPQIRPSRELMDPAYEYPRLPPKYEPPPDDNGGGCTCC